MRRIFVGLLVLVVGIAIGLAVLLRPLPRVAHPPVVIAASYAESQARIARLERRDGTDLHAGCATFALLHGRRTPRAIVLLHGITNCPLQFRDLAVALAAQGDNVLVPRVDRHGLAD